MNNMNPRVGVGVFVRNSGLYLVGHRIGPHEPGTWGLPGGHLEYGESFEQCCTREVREETGLEIKNIRPLSFRNNIFASGKHYVTLFFHAECDQPEKLRNMKPDRHDRWSWFNLVEMGRLPTLFDALRDVLAEIDDGRQKFPPPPIHTRLKTYREFVEKLDIQLYTSEANTGIWVCDLKNRLSQDMLRCHIAAAEAPSLVDVLRGFKTRVLPVALSGYRYSVWRDTYVPGMFDVQARQEWKHLVNNICDYRNFLGEGPMHELLLVEEDGLFPRRMLPTVELLQRTGVYTPSVDVQDGSNVRPGGLVPAEDFALAYHCTPDKVIEMIARELINGKKINDRWYVAVSEYGRKIVEQAKHKAGMYKQYFSGNEFPLATDVTRENTEEKS